jgi:hypothetical protein
MHTLGAVPSPSSNRKRPVRHHEDIDSDEGDKPDRPPGVAQDHTTTANDHYTVTSTPPKRLRVNRNGAAVERRSSTTDRHFKYDVQGLLNHLALVRLYVTSNFQNYNPVLSPVVLCLIATHAELYHALW